MPVGMAGRVLAGRGILGCHKIAVKYGYQKIGPMTADAGYIRITELLHAAAALTLCR
jgi:hypothetical protein